MHRSLTVENVLLSNETLNKTDAVKYLPNKSAPPVKTIKMTKNITGRRALGELKKGKATYLGSGLKLSSLVDVDVNLKVDESTASHIHDVDNRLQDHCETDSVVENHDKTAVLPPEPATPTRDDKADETGDQTDSSLTMTRERALWLMRYHPGSTFADGRFHAQILCHLTHAEACEWRRRGYDDAISAWLAKGKKHARDAQGEEEAKSAAEVISVDDSDDSPRAKRSRRKDAQECAGAIRHQIRAVATVNTSPISPRTSMSLDTEVLSQLATMTHEFRTAVIDNLTFAEVAELHMRCRGNFQVMEQSKQLA